MILLEVKLYPRTEWNQALNLVLGSCPRVLIADRIPTKQTPQRQADNPTRPNTHMESQCINFNEHHFFTSLGSYFWSI